MNNITFDNLVLLLGASLEDDVFMLANFIKYWNALKVWSVRKVYDTLIILAY